MSVSTTKMTARQFLMLGEDPPGVRLELFNGEIAVSPSPTPEHQYTIIKLLGLIDPFVERNDLGEVSMDLSTRLGKFNVPRPDILFFVKDRIRFIGKKCAEKGPDLAIEVISPGSRKIDRNRKFKLYAKRGISFYWIIDPIEHTAEAFQLVDGKYKLIGQCSGREVVQFKPLDGLKIPLSKLWRPTRPGRA